MIYILFFLSSLKRTTFRMFALQNGAPNPPLILNSTNIDHESLARQDLRAAGLKLKY